jgi:hypothetical protein
MGVSERLFSEQQGKQTMKIFSYQLVSVVRIFRFGKAAASASWHGWFRLSPSPSLAGRLFRKQLRPVYQQIPLAVLPQHRPGCSSQRAWLCCTAASSRSPSQRSIIR